MSLDGAGASRAGGEGIHNEDAFLVQEGLGLYVVCDGTSAMPGGEVAAQVAVRALEEFIEHAGPSGSGSRHIGRDLVERAMSYAITAMADVERTDPALRGLSATVTMLLAHRHFGVIGHRGDSRAYLIRNDRSTQLTIDHELTETTSSEEDEHPDFDSFAVMLEPGDTVVLCTDGAEEVIQDDGIVRVASHLTPRVLASRIVSAAHRRTPDVDATAVVVRVLGDSEPGWLELSMPPYQTAFGHTLAAA